MRKENETVNYDIERDQIYAQKQRLSNMYETNVILFTTLT